MWSKKKVIEKYAEAITIGDNKIISYDAKGFVFMWASFNIDSRTCSK